MLTSIKNYARTDRKAFIGLCTTLALLTTFVVYSKIDNHLNPKVNGPWLVRGLLQDWVDSGGIEATQALHIGNNNRQLKQLEKWRSGSGFMSPKSDTTRVSMDQRIANLHKQISSAQLALNTPG